MYDGEVVGLGIVCLIVGAMIGALILESSVPYRQLSLETMNLGEIYVYGSTSVIAGKYYLSLADHNKVVKSYEVPLEKIPAGLQSGDTIAKVQDIDTKKISLVIVQKFKG